MERPKYVSSFIDNRGTLRHRFRRIGYQPGYFTAPIGTEQFNAEYAAFMGDLPARRSKKGPVISARKDLLNLSGDRVYFLKSAGGVVKIGWTNNLRRRVKELQTAAPSKLRLLASVPGTQEDERGLHERFSDLRLQGEWFRLSPDLLAEIQRIKAANCLAPEDTLSNREIKG